MPYLAGITGRLATGCLAAVPARGAFFLLVGLRSAGFFAISRLKLAMPPKVNREDYCPKSATAAKAAAVHASCELGESYFVP